MPGNYIAGYLNIPIPAFAKAMVGKQHPIPNPNTRLRQGYGGEATLNPQFQTPAFAKAMAGTKKAKPYGASLVFNEYVSQLLI